MISPVFCGIKHCGKSTLGRLIASASGVPFTDTDEELEKEFFRREGKKAACRTIFREYGEEYFRKLEADVIRSLSDGKLRVIALGGGVSGAGDFLADACQKELGRIFGETTDPLYCKVRIARYQNDAGILGAALLAKLRLA